MFERYCLCTLGERSALSVPVSPWSSRKSPCFTQCVQQPSIHALYMGDSDGVARRRVLANSYEHCRLSSPRLA